MQGRRTPEKPEKQYLLDAITVHDSWRLFKILAELVDGFETLGEIYPAVTIFGSARVRPGDEIYERTVTIARKLAENGFNVLTGRAKHSGQLIVEPGAVPQCRASA